MTFGTGLKECIEFSTHKLKKGPETRRIILRLTVLIRFQRKGECQRCQILNQKNGSIITKTESIVKTNTETKKARHANQCVSSVNEKIYDHKRSGLEMIWECSV